MARSLYARALHLHHVRPGAALRLVYVEGAVALAGLAALAELASWWGILVLPAVVAALVKVEDMATGYRRARPTAAASEPAPPTVARARAVAPVNPPLAASSPWTQPQMLRVRRPAGAHRALADPDRVWARAAVPQAATPHQTQR